MIIFALGTSVVIPGLVTAAEIAYTDRYVDRFGPG